MTQFTHEQIIAAYRKAPEPVQDVYDGNTLANIVTDIKSRYRLHVDVSGTLAENVGYLLLGLISPAEFFGSIMLAGTDEQTARGIMQEVNERIFLPLKRQMSAPPAPAAAPVASYADAPKAPEPVRPVVPVPELAYEPQTATLPGSPVPAPMPKTQPAAQAPEIPAPSAPPVPETPPVAPAPLPEPPAPLTPAPAPYEAPPAPPAIEPGTNPHPPAPRTAPIQKEFGADPYREPI